MRVDGYGIGEMASFELVRMSGREDSGAAPGGVYVEPEVVSGTDGGDFGKGVIGAEDGGAGRGVHVERRVSVCLGLFNLRGESVRKHASRRISGNGPDGGAAKPKHLGCFFDAVVTVGACEKDELAVLRKATVLLGIGEKSIASNDYGSSVRGRTALGRDAVCVGSGKIEEVGEGAGGGFFDDCKGG